MRFALLGPVQVHGDGGPVEIRGTLRRTLLAALLLHRGSVVSADRLGELIWGERPPASVTTSLYNQIMRLRQALGEDAERIRAVAPGYLVHVEPNELDLDEFSALCNEARRAAASSDWPSSADFYSRALSLWRGEILADVPALQEHPSIHQFTEDHLLALQGRIEADLNLARHDTLIGELRTLTASHPLREAFHGQLMLALYRAGRQADALDAYRDLRRAIVTELGVEPGNAIQALHTDILNSAPSLNLPAAPALRPSPTPPPAPSPNSAAALTPAPAPAPRQLPADTRLFTGRSEELEELTSLAMNLGSAADTVVISAINGMGGIGKTALAVRAGHRVAERFPDGQLFIDLRGYDAKLAPSTAEDALDYLLRSLGVPPNAIPADLDERAALYRSRLAGTRTLIVLDNAASTAQVQPLLPGTPGCLVLITSRNRMMGLDDAHFFALDVLPAPDAVALLKNVAGPTRAADLDRHPEAAADLVARCAHTPLAIRIVAARLRHQASLTVESLAAELCETATLESIQDDDRDLASVFDSSLRMLPEQVRHLFPLLGLIPGPDFDDYAAAHLAATDLSTADRHLATLLDHNLLIQQTPTRYRLHDLLRAHARTLAAANPESPAAFDRLVDYYLTAASAVDRLLGTTTRPQSRTVPHAAEPVRSFDDRSQARSWFDSERACLFAAIESSAITAAYRYALIGELASQLIVDEQLRLAADLHQSAVVSARERGDRVAEGNALVDLGRTDGTLGNPDRALDCLEQALEIFRDIGVKQGEVNALLAVAHVHFQRGHFNVTLATCEQALKIYSDLDDQLSAADIMTHLGRVSHSSGNNTEAKRYFEQAIAIYRAHGATLRESDCLLSASRTYYALEDFDAVKPALERALDHVRDSTHQGGTILQEIVRQHLLVGAYEEASRLFDEALELHLASGFRLSEGNIYYERGRLALAHGNHELATEQCIKALNLFIDIDNVYGESLARHELALVYHAMGNLEPVEALLDRALEINLASGYLVGEVEVRNSIAAYRAEVDGDEAGLKLYREAVELAVRAEHPLERARALEGMARCEVQLGLRASAVEHLGDAVDLYRRMGVVEYAGAAELLGEQTGRSTES